MGCCASRPRPHDGPSAPSPTLAVQSVGSPNPQTSTSSPQSSPAIPISPRPLQQQQQRPQDRTRTRQRGRRGAPAATIPIVSSQSPPNAPLRGPPPPQSIKLPESSPGGGGNDGLQQQSWTQARLRRERAAFFDTRVSGRPEVWAVLRLVSEMMRERQLQEAQSLLDAAGCTCPTGELNKGVFDERGAFYELPAWVVGNPEGVEDEDEDGEENGKDGIGDEDGEGVIVERESEEDEEKGKGRIGDVNVAGWADKGPRVQVRARLSDRGTDVIVNIGSEEPVKILLRRVREQAGLPPDHKVRILYLGKVLRDAQSLAEQGWHEGHVVNAFVFQQ